MRILVTGATGFVGSHLCKWLTAKGHTVVPAARTQDASHPHTFPVGELGPDTEWSSALSGCDAVVHLAARVHMMNDPSPDPEAEYHRVNCEGTLRLAQQALEAGVARFIFISTIKVNGDATPDDAPYTEESPPAPDDPYSRSKWAAEQALQGLHRDRGLPLVILRPPLIYGPGVKANFLKMIRMVDRGLPVPLGCVHNQRSLIGVTNFCSLIQAALDAADGIGECFLAAENQDCSTPELFARVGKALGRPARLIPVPLWALRLAGALTGKRAVLDRLLSSLQVDASKAERLLHWSPVLTMEQELTATVDHYREDTNERPAP
ncbi:MAG: UDP-glucose 4-epimerase family protein [Planctomycetota bacterium]|jgi:nucleoside-diphosphate-sugar epimerase